jgi:ParB family chromosome partitioning protein
MVKKKARLGRGLGALLGDVKATTQADNSASVTTDAALKKATSSPVSNSSASASGFREIPIDQLQRGEYQPRGHMDKVALEELGNSIKSQGILQPLLVRPLAKGQYEIIAGERRWRGAQLAGLQTVPAVVREITDQNAMAVGLIENIQRENLNAIEEAKGYRRLLDEFGLTHQEVSEAVGCSRAQVSNLLRLLALHPKVQTMLESEEVDMGHARALLGLPENQQTGAANLVRNKRLSVRQTEALVKTIIRDDGKKAAGQQPTNSSNDISRLEEDLSNRIGARVDIQHGAKKGKLVIHYHSLDELDGILERIK